MEWCCFGGKICPKNCILKSTVSSKGLNFHQNRGMISDIGVCKQPQVDRNIKYIIYSFIKVVKFLLKHGVDTWYRSTCTT